jgi:hypothetical protein
MNDLPNSPTNEQQNQKTLTDQKSFREGVLKINITSQWSRISTKNLSILQGLMQLIICLGVLSKLLCISMEFSQPIISQGKHKTQRTCYHDQIPQAS